MSEELKIAEKPARGAARYDAHPLPETLEALVQRFHAPVRREVRRLLRTSPRFADLAIVFPGALYALAVRRGPATARLNALALIESRRAVENCCAQADLPMWLRKLPPEAFDELPDALPQSDTFNRKIATRIPTSAAESAFWLKCVLFAWRACHEDFAIWIAEQPIFTDAGDAEKMIAVVAAYAWHSGQPQSSAFKLIVVPWRPEIAFDTALCAAKSWFNRVRLVLQLRPGTVVDGWLKPGSAIGYTFEPLLNQQEILAEAQAMQNCADQYAERLVRDKCRLFSVKRNGVRMATLEVGPHQRESGVLAITQLKARHNMAASTEIWQAAYTWMAGQRDLKRIPPLTVSDRQFDIQAWHDVLHSYREAHDGASWLDEVPTHLMFAGFDADLCDLARRGGVSSWLFT